MERDKRNTPPRAAIRQAAASRSDLAQQAATWRAALERIAGLGGRCTSDDPAVFADDCPHCIAYVALQEASSDA